MTTRIEYPISGGYCENWGMAEILRELIANALDSRAPYQVFYDEEKSEAVIRDEGRGFKAHCLMLGEGEKKDGSQIGQFKEGLKIALLAAARAEIPVTLRTTGCSIESVGMEQLGLGRKGLVLYLNGNKLARGTEVRVRCKAESLQQAKELFLHFNGVPKPVPAIFSLETKQRVYVNGLQTMVGGWAYSYNLHGKDIKAAMNRDRSVIAFSALRDAITLKWSAVRDVRLIQELLTKATVDDGEAHMWIMNYPSRVRKLWARAILRIAGVAPTRKLAVIGINEVNFRLREMGWYLLDTTSLPFIARSLAPSLFPTASAALEEEMRKAELRSAKRGHEGVYLTVKWKAMPDNMIADFEAAVNRVLVAFWRHLPSVEHRKLFDMVDKFRWFVYHRSTLAGDQSIGCWHPGRRAIGIRRDVLSRTTPGVIEGIVAHELAHFLCGAEGTDGSLALENILSNIMGWMTCPPLRPAIDIKVDVRTGRCLRLPCSGRMTWQQVKRHLSDQQFMLHGSAEDMRALEEQDEVYLAGYSFTYTGSGKVKQLLFLARDGLTRTLVDLDRRETPALAKVACVKERVHTGVPFFWADTLPELN